MKKTIIKILVMGIVLRIFLAFSTYHSDIVPFDFAGRVIGGGNVLNFYDYLWDLPETHEFLKVYPRNLFNYPPLPYFFLGGSSLLTTWVVDPVIHNNFLVNLPATFGNFQLNLLLFLLKLPYFFFDIGIAFLLMGLFKSEKNKRLAFTLWMFNPVTLYATYMMGQFDIIPTFLVVGSLYLVSKNKNTFWASVLLGLGAGFKIFPILLLVPLALIKKDLWGKIKILLAGGLTYLISVYPFIFSSGFRKTALLAGQTTKSFYAQIPISGGESIILFLSAIVFLYSVFYFKKTKDQDLWKSFFIMLITFFVFTHFHPQWLLWVTPFFIIDLVKSKLTHWPLYVLILISYLFMISFFDPGLSVWLFAPINKNLYEMSGIWDLLRINVDINVARSIFQSIFAGVCLYFIYLYFPKKDEKKI